MSHALAMAVMAIAAILSPHHAHACHATQPVYSASYHLVGVWTVVLPAGQSVTLPDGDTLTCSSAGIPVVH